MGESANSSTSLPLTLTPYAAKMSSAETALA